MAAVIGAIIVALVSAAGLMYQSRKNADATRGTSLDDRAQKVLDKAMSWQEGTITDLRGRVEVLEAEVESCEVGRRADRDAFSAELARVRDEIRGAQ